MYNRFLATWRIYEPKVQELLIKTIIADLHNRIAESCHQADLETVQPLHIAHIAGYEEELQQELTQTMAQHQLQSRLLPHLSPRSSDARGANSSPKGISTIQSGANKTWPDEAADHQHDTTEEDDQHDTAEEDDQHNIREEDDLNNRETDTFGDEEIPETFDLDPDRTQ